MNRATQPTTVNLVFASHFEAKPFIDRLRLKKSATASLPIFTGKYETINIRLIVTGLGSTETQLAVGYLAGMFASRDELWMNIGVAGHSDLPIGEPVLVHAVELDDDAFHYVPLISKWSGKTAILKSQTPTENYPPDRLLDMEGSAFFRAAMRFTSSELVQSVKIVSDNATRSWRQLERNQATELIKTQLPLLLDTVKGIGAFLPSKQSMLWHTWHSDLQCSHSHRRRIHSMLLALQSIQGIDQELMRKLQQMKETRAIVQFLQQEIRRREHCLRYSKAQQFAEHD